MFPLDITQTYTLLTLLSSCRVVHSTHKQCNPKSLGMTKSVSCLFIYHMVFCEWIQMELYLGGQQFQDHIPKRRQKGRVCSSEFIERESHSLLDNPKTQFKYSTPRLDLNDRMLLPNYFSTSFLNSLNFSKNSNLYFIKYI